MSRWLRFTHDGEEGFGRLDDGEGAERVVVHEGDMFDAPHPTGTVLSLTEVALLPPVQPGKLVALWNNSKSLAEKQGLATPDHPLYFVKTPNSYAAPGTQIRKPTSYDGRVIFEAELGIVIGRPCSGVSEAEAGNHIFGYTCVNDVTALELIQSDPSFPQWVRAKSFDTFAPFGPWIATRIDADTLSGARVRAELQGRERQNYPVSDLVFGPTRLVSLVSRDMTLMPGDVISCGTGPGAVPMRPGMRIDVVIDGIGRLSNEYVA